MRAALAYVAAHPGCSKSDAVRDFTGPVTRLGPADRIIAAGWVKAEAAGPGRGYRLYVTEQGTAVLREGAGR
jgi:hypothetical protein